MSSMHVQPVCVKCQVSMQPDINGVVVVEMSNNPPQPYRFWNADMWKCPRCGVQIVKGFCEEPVMEHFEDGFEEALEQAKQRARRVVYEYEGL